MMSFTPCKASLSICSASTTACPSPQPTTCGLDRSFSVFFFLLCYYYSNFIRLMRKIVFVLESFDYFLCFCSNCSMLYFVTVEEKKQESVKNKRESHERQIIIFYSTRIILSEKNVWSCIVIIVIAIVLSIL